MVFFFSRSLGRCGVRTGKLSRRGAWKDVSLGSHYGFGIIFGAHNMEVGMGECID